MENIFNITPLKRFYNLLNVDRQEIISIYVYALFNGIITLSLPLGIQAIINFISGGQMSTSWIVLVFFVIAGVALSGIMQIMQLTITENIQRKIFTRSAFEFAYRIPRMKLEAVDNYYMPELVNRFFDTLSVQKGLSKILIDFSGASLQIIFGLILLSLYHPFFILFSLVLVIIVYGIFRFLAPKGLKTSIDESKHKYYVAHWLEEVGRSMETFKLAGSTPIVMSKTDDVVEGYLDARKKHFKALIFQYINLVGLKVIIAAGLLLIGGLLVINQQMNIGQFVASEIIILLVLSSVEKLILIMETIYDVLTAIEKIGNVTDIPLDDDTGVRLDHLKEEGISIRLDNLSYQFKEPLTKVLKDIELDIASNEKICLSGYDGSGKSVMLHILAGLYEDYTGSLSFNGVPLGNWNKEDLHTLTGDNLSKEDIFKGTLLENISLDKPSVSMEQMQAIVELLGLETFVRSLPKGYHTMLMPEGKNIPKNIRLRIMLARSIAGNPKLLLLDDSFNTLNTSTKKAYLDYILQRKITVVAVSNDPLVIERMERVVVLDNGMIKGEGTHAELSKQIWYLQLIQSN